MPVHVQPSLFPEHVFAVVHTYRDTYRPECEPCQWIGTALKSYAFASRAAHTHDESYHAD